MRFMMLMIPEGYGDADPGYEPEPEAVAKMAAYNEELESAGVLLEAEGLHPPSTGGARVSFAGGEPRVTDGPFAETKEVVGGYWMIEVGSKEEAIEWAERCPAAQTETIEVRRVQEWSDFSDELRAAFDDAAGDRDGTSEPEAE